MNPLPESRDLRPLKVKKAKKHKSKVEHKDGQRSADNARGHKPKGKNPRHRSDNNSNNNNSKPSKNGARKANPNRNKAKAQCSNDPYAASR
jgi:ATP-dependent RNA helicase RhlE